MKTIFGHLVLISALLIVCVGGTLAADGDLDLTFGTGGKTTIDFNGNPTPGEPDQDSGLDVAIQPDGKIIIVGESFISSTDSVMSATRLNTDGKIDPTFGTNGRFMYNAAVGIAERAYGAAVQADGKILIAGRTGSPRQRVVIRLNSDGTFDTTFGTAGVFMTPTGSTTFDEPEITTQPDGKIIVIGSSRNEGAITDAFSVMRLNTDGTLDNTFSENGEAVTVFQASDRAYGVAIQSDGMIVVSGGTNNNGAMAVARYQSDGKLDNTFGVGGKITTSFPGSTALAYNLAIQPDGKILACGYARIQNSDAIIVRYNADGSLDTGFGTGGSVRFGNTNNEIIWDVFYKNGKILGAGNRGLSAGQGSPEDFMMVRFDSAGVLDTGFGNAGVIYTDFNLTRDICLTAVMQPDGKVVLAGYSTGSVVFDPDFAAARYTFDSGANRPAQNDFDFDGKADLSIVRPVNGGTSQWWIQRSGSNSVRFDQLGLQTDVISPADYDGDGKTDIAVWRPAPATQAAFIILKSSDNTIRQETFGQTGDKPVVADYDGDGKADLAIYRNGVQSYFYYRGSQNNANGITTFIPWGTAGDKPVVGDYNGDGRSDFAIFRNGTWWILQNGTFSYTIFNWGLSTDVIVPGDYDGDAKTDIAVFRPSNGFWYILNSSNASITYQKWGIGTDVLVPSDYDGDGKTDFAVYRNGVWYINQSSSGNLQVGNFGIATDIPAPSINVVP